MPSTNKNHFLLKVALTVTVIAVIILSALLVQQYVHIQRLDYIAAHRESLLRSLHGSGPLSAADASSTQSWMTFDYLNRAFVLPPTYLETSLGITDGRFPRMTIAEYASDVGTSSQSALMNVEDAIGAYFSAKQ